jgi:protein SCO1
MTTECHIYRSRPPELPLVARTGAVLLFLLTLPSVVHPAYAHHPGADLDKAMGSQEKYFQVIDEPAAPPFDLANASGSTVRLSDFSDKIVVLNFIYASCTDVCPCIRS